jgi:hypothetical protein
MEDEARSIQRPPFTKFYRIGGIVMPLAKMNLAEKIYPNL